MHRTSILCLLALLPLLASSARGDEIPAELLARYINNDTLLVVGVNADQEFLLNLHALVEPHVDVPDLSDMMEKLKPILENWGNRKLYLIVGVADFPTPGPLALITAAPGENAAQFSAFAEKIREHAPFNPREDFIGNVRVMDGPALLIGTNAALARIDTLKPQPRPDLLEPLATQLEDNAAIAAVLAPGPDARRVLREMWPQLPAPGGDITGPLLADRVRNVTFAAKLPPQWSADLAIHTTDDQTAATIAKTGEKVVQQYAPLIQQQVPLPGVDWRAVLETATPKQANKSVLIRLDHQNGVIAKTIVNLATDAVESARAAAQRSVQMNNIKQIGLAFHNFHDTQKHFPASAAICDKDGKPLLSWRVAILPFIEEQALFDEFHLDEPWDSEHNIKLLERMPKIFADPAQRDPAGKTTLLLPVQSETVFPPSIEPKLNNTKFRNKPLVIAEGLTYRDITDGTSQTILLVEVAPESAVPWTKPADWEVDLEDPLNGLRQEGRDGFVAGFCDGHGKYIGFDISPGLLKKLLTRAGGELIDEAY